MWRMIVLHLKIQSHITCHALSYYCWTSHYVLVVPLAMPLIILLHKNSLHFISHNPSQIEFHNPHLESANTHVYISCLSWLLLELANRALYNYQIPWLTLDNCIELLSTDRCIKFRICPCVTNKLLLFTDDNERGQ